MKLSEDKTYVILGAPHSATSFVSKILEKGGIKMNSDKRKNRRILYSAKGGVHRPPTEKKILQTNYIEDIKRFIDTRKGKFWGWKDPRMSLTIKKYLPHLEGDIYLICCFRKPKKVLKSSPKHFDKKAINQYNESIINAIREFCELKK